MNKLTKIYQKLLPSPFTIAIILTLITFVASFFFKPQDQSISSYLLQITGYWEQGLWDPSKGGLYFAFQMMLMLVLGHVLALSAPVSRIIHLITRFCTNTATSALFISFTTILVSFFSWGLALIFGAVLARKTGEKFSAQQKGLNYGLIGACGYVGLMTWHGGLSGSAPLKAAEEGNIKSMFPAGMDVPNQIPLTETILSASNITIFMLLLILIPLIMYFIGKKSADEIPQLSVYKENDFSKKSKPEGAERIDFSKLPGVLTGSLIVFYLIFQLFKNENYTIDPNFINLALLGLSLLFHKSFKKFLDAVGHAIGDSSGILIQFPLYFGIIGIMKSSGMITSISSWFVENSGATSFPLFTFFSAGLVNIFVPSGGGQWVVQGPIVVQAAQEMDIGFGKIIMALAYGDQLTNMLQPFWALPLLGITGLKAQEILPYTLILFFIGLIIFGTGILLLL